MLASYPSDVVTLDPRLAVRESAPGVPNAGRRDSTHTAALARELNARVSTELARPGVHLLLSAPLIRADTAELSITAAWSGSGGRARGQGGYETRGLVLVRTQGIWRVARFRQLGIS